MACCRRPSDIESERLCDESEGGSPLLGTANKSRPSRLSDPLIGSSCHNRRLSCEVGSAQNAGPTDLRDPFSVPNPQRTDPKWIKTIF